MTRSKGKRKKPGDGAGVPRKPSRATSVEAPDKASLRRARFLSKEVGRLLRKYQKRLETGDEETLRSALSTLDDVIADGRDAMSLRAAEQELEEKADRTLGFAKKSPLREYVESILVALLIAGLLRAFVIEAFKIPTGSMIPTLAVGDHIFVNKFVYGLKVPFTNAWFVQWGSPDRGDVVVFRFPKDPSTDYIKRIVAVAGDRVRVRGKDVFVNGRALAHRERPPVEFVDPGDLEMEGGALGDGSLDLDTEQSIGLEEPASHRTAMAFDETSAGDENTYTVIYEQGGRSRGPFPSSREGSPPGLECSFEDPESGECKVLDGYVFAMGDNRDNSSDGRVWGGVPLSHLEGKALFVWWSWTTDRGIQIRWDRLGTRVR